MKVILIYYEQSQKQPENQVAIFDVPQFLSAIKAMLVAIVIDVYTTIIEHKINTGLTDAINWTYPLKPCKYIIVVLEEPFPCHLRYKLSFPSLRLQKVHRKRRNRVLQYINK